MILANDQKTILLVEDFDDARFMMRRMLEMEGYRVVEARDGQEAVEKARRGCPDLILMDLSLPGISGLEATRQIRQMKSLCAVPVIAVTAFDEEDFRSEAMASGCNCFIAKPVDFNLLERVIAEQLAGSAVACV